MRLSGRATAEAHALVVLASSRDPPIHSRIGRISGNVRKSVITTAAPVSTRATAITFR